MNLLFAVVFCVESERAIYLISDDGPDLEQFFSIYDRQNSANLSWQLQ